MVSVDRNSAGSCGVEQFSVTAYSWVGQVRPTSRSDVSQERCGEISEVWNIDSVGEQIQDPGPNPGRGGKFFCG